MSEKKTIFNHASVILIGQFSSIAFGVVDTVIAGHNSPHDLAVLSIGNAVYVTVYVALIGAIQALLPMFAEMNGAKKYTAIGDLFRQTLYVWVSLFIPGCLIPLYPSAIFSKTRVDNHVTTIARSYLSYEAILLPGSLFFRLFGALNQSIGNPRIVTWIQIGGLLAKIPLTVYFFHAHGILGCAISTGWVTYGMCACALYLLWTRPTYEALELWKPMSKPDAEILKQMSRLAVPNFLCNLVEITSFSMLALFISRLGEIESASHQIAANMTSLLFMVPLSLSIATSARFSYWIGAKNDAEVRSILDIGFMFVIIESCFFALFLFSFSTPVARFYSKS